MNQNEIIDLIKTTLEVKIDSLNNKIAGKDKIIELQDAQLADYRRMIDHYQKLLDKYTSGSILEPAPEITKQQLIDMGYDMDQLTVKDVLKKEKEEAYNRGFVDRSKQYDDMIPHHAIHFLQFLERNKIITINIPHSTGQFINLFFASQNEPPKTDDSLPQNPGL